MYLVYYKRDPFPFFRKVYNVHEMGVSYIYLYIYKILYVVVVTVVGVVAVVDVIKVH